MTRSDAPSGREGLGEHEQIVADGSRRARPEMSPSSCSSETSRHSIRWRLTMESTRPPRCGVVSRRRRRESSTLEYLVPLDASSAALVGALHMRMNPRACRAYGPSRGTQSRRVHGSSYSRSSAHMGAAVGMKRQSAQERCTEKATACKTHNALRGTGRTSDTCLLAMAEITIAPDTATCRTPVRRVAATTCRASTQTGVCDDVSRSPAHLGLSEWECLPFRLRRRSVRLRCRPTRHSERRAPVPRRIRRRCQ